MSNPRQSSHPRSLAGEVWLRDAPTQAVLACLNDAGFEARIVGGAVRDALLCLPVRDIDIATPARPKDVIAAAGRAGLKAVPTGFDHGTVTVISGNTPFEVTTLRQDIETDGRHATVAYTGDWEKDALRRDFTINALYCDAGGKIFDPVGGLDDLLQHRVRFIGAAVERISEDYLRILRFFRFAASYGKGQLDSQGLEACKAQRHGLERLAGERIAAEILQLLQAPHAPSVVAAMRDANIISQLFDRAGDVKALHRMAAIETTLGIPPGPLTRLAALLVDNPEDAVALRERLKLSSRDFDRLARMSQRDNALTAKASEQDAKVFIYRHGAEAFRDGLMLAWARSDGAKNDTSWVARFRLTERWQAPEFPLTGTDVLALGIAPGVSVGRILRRVEDWWIDAGFPDDMARIRAVLAEQARVTKF